MRFKAKMSTEQVSILQSVITPISKLTSTTASKNNTGSNSASNPNQPAAQYYRRRDRCVVLYLDPHHIRISTKNSTNEDGVCCFSELSASSLFLEHRVESISDNVILMQVDLLVWKQALSNILSMTANDTNNKNINNGGNNGSNMDGSIHNQSGFGNNNSNNFSILQPMMEIVVFKLAKRNGIPCLCLEGGSQVLELHHAIPVRILRTSEMQQYLPPQINMPQVQLELPPVLSLRSIIERLKAMTKYVYLEGTVPKGELTIRVDQEGCSLACHCPNMIPRYEEGEQHRPHRNCTLKVHAQTLYTCLAWQQLKGPFSAISSSLLGMVENEMLVLHQVLEEGDLGFFTYYVPALYLSPDDLE